MKATATKRRMCEGKQRHEARDTAENQMYGLVRTQGARLAALNVYRCPYCAGWHVGHRPGNTRPR